MALEMEEAIKFTELHRLRNVREQQPLDDPDLDPVLLIPGIAGSILHAVGVDGKEERVWVRILGADQELRDKLWSRFDPSTGRTISLDKSTRIIVPGDRYGLYAIDVLDPDLVIGREGVFYFHDMIEEMIKWGFEEGKTLFGFGFDFRQSNRVQETLESLCSKLQSVYTSSSGKKINLITHSMGALVVKCFIALHSDIFEKYVKSWIAVAAPFQGAPGYITTSLLNGMSFVEGWEQNFFISKWTMHQLLIECPSMYELMANPEFCWSDIPLLQVWRKRSDCTCKEHTVLESYESADAISVMSDALSHNMMEYDGEQIPLPFNLEILKWANETRQVLSHAKLPSSVKFYNIYGINNGTPNTVCYGSEKEPISDLTTLPWLKAKYIYVNGDGSVPAESAKADGFNATARVAVAADHRGIICDQRIFRIIRHWLKADHDPFYDPLNDYVILPTIFDIECCFKDHVRHTAFNEWEIISHNDFKDGHEPPPDEQKAMAVGVALSSSLMATNPDLPNASKSAAMESLVGVA